LRAGVICFTKSLALQAAPYKINGNAVCQGPTHAAMTDENGGFIMDRRPRCSRETEKETSLDYGIIQDRDVSKLDRQQVGFIE
jgi:NAD(P)-dependent dehydrogenase (short-subunit alcohol dehydrogenase family)